MGEGLLFSLKKKKKNPPLSRFHSRHENCHRRHCSLSIAAGDVAEALGGRSARLEDETRGEWRTATRWWRRSRHLPLCLYQSASQSQRSTVSAAPSSTHRRVRACARSHEMHNHLSFLFLFIF